VREAERVTHFVADLRAAQVVNGNHLRIGAGRDVVKAVGVIGEKYPVRLVGVRDELDIRGEFPFAQAVRDTSPAAWWSTCW
jgi:hypothetical protein